MIGAEDELGGAIPYCHDHLITAEEGVQRLVEATGESKIANLYLAGRGHHDVGGLEITVEYPVGVEVLTAVEELEHDALDCSRRYRVSRLLSVVMDNL